MSSKINTIENCIEFCRVMISAFPRNVNRKLIIPISIFMSIADFASDVLLLLNNQRSVSATIVLRSMIEMLLDLSLLDIDLEYVNSLLLRYQKDNKEILQDCLNPNSEKYIQDEGKRNEVRQQLSILKNGPIGNINGKYKLMEPSEKFQILNASHFHKCVYRQLSREVHCGLSVIERRHIREGRNGKITLAYNQSYSEKEFPVSEPLLLTIILSIITINSILDVGMELQINDLIKNVNLHIKDEKMGLLPIPSE